VTAVVIDASAGVEIVADTRRGQALADQGSSKYKAGFVKVEFVLADVDR